MNLAMWRWKDSRDVDPRAQCRVGSLTPPLSKCPVRVYSGMLGGSWMQGRWCCSTSQISRISSLKRGTPSVSVEEDRAKRRLSIRCVVSSGPLVLRLQCLNSSLEVRASFTAVLDGLGIPAIRSSSILALMRRSTSCSPHNMNMQLESCDMNIPYKGCDSLVHPLANLLMKCQMSRRTCSPSQLEKRICKDNHHWILRTYNMYVRMYIRASSFDSNTSTTYYSHLVFGWTTPTATVPVCIEENGRFYTSLLIPAHQPSCHLLEPILSFRFCEDGDQHLSSLIGDIDGPAGCIRSCSLQFLADLLGGINL